MAWDAGKQQRIQQGIKVSRFYLKHNIFLSFKKNRLLCKFFEKQHTPIRKQESRKENYRVLPPGGGVLPYITYWQVCTAQRGRDFEAPDLERSIHFRGVF